MRDTTSKTGSALILVVVLTSLLAIVGVMFVMAARVNKIATSGIAENKDLDSAVETVIAQISHELFLDVPDVSTLNSDYYDYPGSWDEWLACLEPYKDSNNSYKWRQISDIYNKLGADLELNANIIIDDYQDQSQVGDSNSSNDYPADADGDGIADSKWIELDDITSNKGKPIYAAIRVVDNGAMLNVNTSYKFDANESEPNKAHRIDGSSLTQINLAALSRRGSNGTFDSAADKLQYWRCGKGAEPYGENDIPQYEREVIWKYSDKNTDPNWHYTPFDIADELELRNRFTINRSDIDTRIENLWKSAFKDSYLRTPVDSSAGRSNWYKEVYYDDPSDPNDPNAYSYRHIGTVHNMDRIMNPLGGRMLNINKEKDKDLIRATIRYALDTDPNFTNPGPVAAQTTVNLVDYRDSDSNVTFYDDANGITYYGFERPCIYISELAHAVKEITPTTGPIGAPPVYSKAYAIELYKPYPLDADPCNWRLLISLSVGGPNSYDIHWSGNYQYYVMQNDPCSMLPIGPNTVIENSSFVLDANGVVALQRRIDDINNPWITVDSRTVPQHGLIPDPCRGINVTKSLQRDINLHKCIRRLWSSPLGGETLGSFNSYTVPGALPIQAHPPDHHFTNVGEIGMVFRKCAYSQGPNPIEPNHTEANVRLDLEKSAFQQLFNFLTVIDPTEDGIDNDEDGSVDEYALNQTPELKIPGRININTAPWFVLRRLPWMRTDIARKIIEYRDSSSGFGNIAELMDVDEMGYYADQAGDLADFPDLTRSDGAPDDFEERDVIFARISNLVTVNSDVFTAYILVRVGRDGPQKRVMAILDRSSAYPGGAGKVITRIIHPVSDPR